MPRQRKKGIKGNGSVFLRKDGRWVAQFIVEETGKTRQLYAPTEKEANEKLQKALQEQKQGILATGPKQKLGEYLNWWLEEVQKQKIRNTSYMRYRSVLNNHLIPDLGQVQLQKLTTRMIQTFCNDKLKQKQSISSVTSMCAVLRNALRAAVKYRYLSYNPADGVSLPKGRSESVGQSLTLEQAQHLLKVARGRRLEAFIALALTTGMRHGELLALRWSDIHFETGSIFIHRTVNYQNNDKFVEGPPKTKKSERTVLLAPAMRVILEVHKHRQEEARREAQASWVEKDLIFCNNSGGFLHAYGIRCTFYRLIDRANKTPDKSGAMLHIPKVRIHDLRHTASTLWQSLGVSEKVAQDLLGHSTLEMTRNTYTHIIPSMQKEATEKINSLLQ